MSYPSHMVSERECHKQILYFIGKTDQVDNECTGGQPEEPKRKNASDNEFDHNKILDGSSGNHKLAVNDAAEKKDQRDELYDPSKFILSFIII